MGNNAERNKLIKELEWNGFVYTKQKGGHRQFVHPITRNKITVPFNIKKNIELSVRRNIKKNNEALGNE